MSAWSDGASACDGCVGRVWVGRLEPVHSGVAGLAVGWKSVLDAWSNGASADDGCVRVAWSVRLKPVHSSVAWRAGDWKSVLDACGGSPGVALSCDWCAVVETELGSGEKGDRHHGRDKGEAGDRHRGRGKGACVEGFGQMPSCIVESDVRARSRSGGGGTGGVSIRDSGGSCCWHGGWGG